MMIIWVSLTLKNSFMVVIHLFIQYSMFFLTKQLTSLTGKPRKRPVSSCEYLVSSSQIANAKLLFSNLFFIFCGCCFFQGIWAPRKIDNPEFFEDSNPFAMKTIAAVGFELWSMQSDILFDNLIITDDQSILNQWTMQRYHL